MNIQELKDIGHCPTNKIIHGDCFEGMQYIENNSVDLILCDLPYGVTANKWDIQLPLDKLWVEYKRILKTPGTVVLTATQPFTTDLVNSNRDWFKYDLIWNKCFGDFLNASRKPLTIHESILIFYEKAKYNRINSKKPLENVRQSNKTGNKNSSNYGNIKNSKIVTNKYESAPCSIIKINGNNQGQHATQKPVKLFEYLIKSYSDKNDIILDNCIGSGTTAIAAIKTGRQFIGFEKEKKYYDITMKRIQDEYNKNTLFEPEKATEWQQQTILNAI